MWKKEILDTLKQTAIVLSLLLLMPVVYGINTMRFSGEHLSLTWYIQWGVNFLVPLLILYLSYLTFAGEDSSGAAEYLKSLPVSNWKLLALKVIPRFVVVVLCLVIAYKIFFRENCTYMGNFVWFFLPYSLIRILYSLFLILIPLVSGFLLGISERKNPILVAAFMIPIVYLYISTNTHLNYLIFRFLYHSVIKPLGLNYLRFFNIISMVSFIIAVVIPATLPLLVLISIFKSWDVSSGKIRSRRILKRMAGPLALITALYTFEQLHLY